LPPGAWDLAKDMLGTLFRLEDAACLEWEFGKEKARRIEVPVLHVVGGNALAPAREAIPLLEEWLPRVETVEVAGATHLGLSLTHSRQTAEVIADFLQRQATRSAQ
jgi:pimeloyl-ACP methyl ester carboxylesterase